MRCETYRCDVPRHAENLLADRQPEGHLRAEAGELEVIRGIARDEKHSAESLECKRHPGNDGAAKVGLLEAVRGNCLAPTVGCRTALGNTHHSR
jgi:hypothetical protein